MNLFYVTRKKVSVGVEYNTNTVEYIVMLQFIVSVLQCMEKGNLLIHYLLSVYHSLD